VRGATHISLRASYRPGETGGEVKGGLRGKDVGALGNQFCNICCVAQLGYSFTTYSSNIVYFLIMSGGLNLIFLADPATTNGIY